MNKSNKRRGFTFPEILLSLAIILAVSTFLYIAVSYVIKSGKIHTAKSGCATVGVAVSEYCFDMDVSKTAKGSVTLAEILLKTRTLNGTTKGPWLKRGSVFDPWGVEYRYIVNCGNIVVWSFGADKTDNCSGGSVFFNSDGTVKTASELSGKTGDDIFITN